MPDVLTPLADWGHAHRRQPSPYEDTPSYGICAAWLDEPGIVEDWGCGTAWARQYFRQATYVGIDGTGSNFSDKIADLRTYRSSVPGIMMRHVLEHSTFDEWKLIAANFAASWTHRAALVMFIPPQPDDFDAGKFNEDDVWTIPDTGVSGPALAELMDPNGDVTFAGWIEMHYPPDHSMQWGWEGIWLMERG